MAGKQRTRAAKRQPAARRQSAGHASSSAGPLGRGSGPADLAVEEGPPEAAFTMAPAALPSLLMRQAAIPQLGGVIGNRAVSSLITRQRTGSPGSGLQRLAADAPGPADIVAQSAFNPMDIADKLMIAIDQKQWAIHSHGPPGYTRHVDFDVVAALLNNKTRSEIRAIDGAYFKYLQDQEDEGRQLREDLLGGGESHMPSDLTPDQRVQTEVLLGGTRAEEGAAPDQQSEAAANAALARATELHTLLEGSLKKDDVEKVMVLLRKSTAENAALIHEYEDLYKVSIANGLSNLDMNQAIQASMLLTGSSVAADSFKVGQLRARIAAIDAGIAELTKPLDTSGVLEGLISVGAAVTGGASDPYGIRLKQLRDERAELVADIERRGEQAAAEAGAEAKSNKLTGAQTDSAVKARLGAVLGDTESLATAIGGRDANVIRGIAWDDPVAKLASQLRKLEADGDLDAKKLTAAMHGLREEAEQRAHRAFPVGPPEAIESESKRLADKYFVRLKEVYDQITPAGAPNFEKLIELGDDTDEEQNRALFMGHGNVRDLYQLQLALAGDHKDTEAVERVLRNKNADQIAQLSKQYADRTGHSLELDLFGEARTTAGGEDNEQAIKMVGGSMGKAEGTSRLNIEDYMQRPSREGGLEEVLYIQARAQREHDYTIEHRGKTGWWRDAWGNEQRNLLDHTMKEVDRLASQYITALGWSPFDPLFPKNPSFARTPRAHQMIQQMRLSRVTIRGDRAAYEKATAELRATFEAIASFVIQAALTAVLGPIAEAVFAVEAAEASVMAVRVAKWAEQAVTATASTIGSHAMVYGSDYSLAMLKSDLLGGMGNAIGAPLAQGMLNPVTGGLVKYLGPKLTGEIVEFGKGFVGMEATAALEGKSLTADISARNLVQMYGMGKLGTAITKTTGTALGIPPPGAGAGGGHGPEETPGAGETAPGSGETVPAAEPPTTAGAVPEVAPGPGSGAASGSAATAPHTGEGVAAKGLPEPGGSETSVPAQPEVPETNVQDAPGAAEEGPASGQRPGGAQLGAASASGSPPGGGALEGTVLQAADKNNEVEAFRLYRRQIAADPNREVAMIYNHAAKEWAIVQGGPNEVSITQALERLGWDAKSTSFGRHSHPDGVLAGQTSEMNQLPSGRGYDLDVVREDSAKGPAPEASQWHAIDIMIDGKPDRTFLVYSPKTKKWLVDFPDKGERGGRGQIEFSTTAEYNEWFHDRFGEFPRNRPPGGAPETLEGVSLEEAQRLRGLEGQVAAALGGEGGPEAGGNAPGRDEARAQVEDAQQVLADRSAPPEAQGRALEVVISESLARARAVHTASGQELTPEDLANYCERGRDITADSILGMLRDSPGLVIVERVQMSNIMEGQSHALTLVTLPGGARFLVDPTFAQFFTTVNEMAPTGGGMLETPEGAALGEALLRDGMIPLTEASARDYMRALGADPAKAGGLADQLLAGDAAVVTDLVQNGKVDRVPGKAANNSDNLMNVLGVHGKDGSVEGVRALLVSLEPGDPRIPILEDLAADLEALSTIQEPLPEPYPP